MEQRHAHPITVFRNLWRIIYLVIIPVLRGFFSALQGGFSSWLRGAWFDILVLIVMVAIAVVRWYSITYSLEEDALYIHTGIYRKKDTYIPWDRIVSVSVLKAFFLKPFHAVHLRADTLGGSFGNADFSIYLTPTKAEHIMSVMRRKAAVSTEYDYSPRSFSILALALLTSNSVAGVLFIAAFISQTGKLLGDEFSNALIGTMESVARSLAFGIPPAAAMLAYLLLFGWFVGFLQTFLQYKGMLVSHTGDILLINGGIFSKREYCIRYGDINFLDIRQNFATKILRMQSLYISAVGYGKDKNDITCVIPTEWSALFARSRAKLFPAFQPTERQYAPPKTGFMRFVGEPLYFCLGIPVAMLLFTYFFPNWTRFIFFVGLMLMVPSLLFLLVRIIDFRTCGVSYDGKNYTLRYSRGFNLHIAVIPRQAVVKIDLRQGVFQRFGGYCDLIVYSKAEGYMRHKCRNLGFDEMSRLFLSREI